MITFFAILIVLFCLLAYTGVLTTVIGWILFPVMIPCALLLNFFEKRRAREFEKSLDKYRGTDEWDLQFKILYKEKERKEKRDELIVTLLLGLILYAFVIWLICK